MDFLGVEGFRMGGGLETGRFFGVGGFCVSNFIMVTSSSSVSCMASEGAWGPGTAGKLGVRTIFDFLAKTSIYSALEVGREEVVALEFDFVLSWIFVIEFVECEVVLLEFVVAG